MPVFTIRFTKEDWTAILAQKEQEEGRAELAATRLNEPFAAPGFAKNLEESHHCRLLRRPPGRPPKPKALAA